MGEIGHRDAENGGDGGDEPVRPDSVEKPIEPCECAVAEDEVPSADDQESQRRGIVPYFQERGVSAKSLREPYGSEFLKRQETGSPLKTPMNQEKAGMKKMHPDFEAGAVSDCGVVIAPQRSRRGLKNKPGR